MIKRSLAFVFAFVLALCSLNAHAQMMDSRFNYMKKYMGLYVYGGYAYQTFEHASLGRFAQSFNQVFAGSLQTQLSIPAQFSNPVIGVEVSAAAIRIGFAHRLAQPMEFEAAYKNGSIRRMQIEVPENNFYFDVLAPMAKGKAYLGMTVGADFGYYRLHSYLHNNFGKDTYSNGDGVSGIFRSHLNVQGRLGARLDIHLVRRVSVSLRAEMYNKVIAAPETALNGWQDEFHVDATLSEPREWRKYLPEDVNQRHNDYVYMGNTLWETSPAVYGDPKGMIYSATFNVQLISFSKNNHNEKE